MVIRCFLRIQANLGGDFEAGALDGRMASNILNRCRVCVTGVVGRLTVRLFQGALVRATIAYLRIGRQGLAAFHDGSH